MCSIIQLNPLGRSIFEDVVVPVPTSFDWSLEAEQTEDRHLLVFYAASPTLWPLYDVFCFVSQARYL